MHPTSNIDLKGKTLVLPVVSTANVAQLAVDLLIASLQLERIGIFDSLYLVPVVGSAESGQGVCTPLELYGTPGLDVVFAQQRSPVLKSQKAEFVSAFSDFIRTSGIAATLVLSGVDLSNRTDSQMITPTYQLSRPDVSTTPLARLASLPLPKYTSPVPHRPMDENQAQIPFIPGGSLTRRILDRFWDDQSLPTAAAILQFALEGDNRADSAMLASAVVATLDLKVAGFVEPASWKQGLFGAPPIPDETLYG
ncbi:unnamed protein product [Mycena citricolor]|uniref:Proteasome assembly chaperone 2 n=1 Tax=Mycena citricolor TaxID=2018698 RepID=A0AAD2HX35_9AGAR|nr:unnamed protein product [Mycena citricolor]